jgi:hypothetical protein
LPCCAACAQDLDLHCNFGLGDGTEAALQPLSCLASLTSLDLGGCGMQRLPRGLRLPALRSLALWSNRLAEGGEDALSCLTDMPRLTALSLSANGLRELPPQVTVLSKLASLSLSRNRDAKRSWVLDLDLLPHLRALTQLDIAGCDLQYWPMELQQLHNLQVGAVRAGSRAGGIAWEWSARSSALCCARERTHADA